MYSSQHENVAPDVSSDPRWGFSPISRRYVKRTGAVWKRLVKSGAVSDPEVAQQLSNNTLASAWAAVKGRPPRSNNVAIEDPPPARQVSRVDAVNARKTTKKLIAQHVDELEGMQPDQVDAMLRRLLAMKMGDTREKQITPTRKIEGRQETPALRVKVAQPRKAPGRKLRVADLFSTDDTSEVPTSEYSD